MEALFGIKQQFLDSEYDLALDLDIFKTQVAANRHKFINFQRIEAKLTGNPETWYKFLEPFTSKLSDERYQLLDNFYQFDQDLVKHWFTVLSRGIPKRTTLVFYGKSNSGKSLVANALVHPLSPGMIQRDGGTNDHWLEHIYRKSVVIWEEPSINMINVDDCKLLFGGEKIIINRKNKNLIERTNPAAVIVTTNKRFWAYDPTTLKNRCWIYHFTGTLDPSIKFETSEIISYLCELYKDGYRQCHSP